MSREQIAAMFPNASKSCIEANGSVTITQPAIPSTASEPKLRKRRRPNKIEAEYGLILEAMKRRGEIIHYVYEGITLHWGDGMRYTCDFALMIEDMPIKLIEVKGKKFWPGDLVRFKGCRAEWKTYFDFELHQRKDGQWSRIH